MTYLHTTLVTLWCFMEEWIKGNQLVTYLHTTLVHNWALCKVQLKKLTHAPSYHRLCLMNKTTMEYHSQPWGMKQWYIYTKTNEKSTNHTYCKQMVLWMTKKQKQETKQHFGVKVWKRVPLISWSRIYKSGCLPAILPPWLAVAALISLLSRGITGFTTWTCQK